MRKGYLIIMLLTTVTFATPAQSRPNVYVTKCTKASPLQEYEPCEPGYYTAELAKSCAMDAANMACFGEANRFCEFLGNTYKHGMSQEYPGYQYCEVTVTLEGFK